MRSDCVIRSLNHDVSVSAIFRLGDSTSRQEKVIVENRERRMASCLALHLAYARLAGRAAREGGKEKAEGHVPLRPAGRRGGRASPAPTQERPCQPQGVGPCSSAGAVSGVKAEYHGGSRGWRTPWSGGRRLRCRGVGLGRGSTGKRQACVRQRGYSRAEGHASAGTESAARTEEHLEVLPLSSARSSVGENSAQVSR